MHHSPIVSPVVDALKKRPRIKLTTAIKSCGLEVCGSGMFGAVFRTNGSTRVIKVAQMDNAYDAFVDAVVTLGHYNPMFPRFLKTLGEYQVTKRKVRVVRFYEMEQLRPVSDKDQGFAHRYKPWERRASRFILYFGDALRNGWGTADVSVLSTVSGHSTKHVAEALSMIKSTGYAEDIHDGNVMWRGNRLVVVDPVWG